MQVVGRIFWKWKCRFEDRKTNAWIDSGTSSREEIFSTKQKRSSDRFECMEAITCVDRNEQGSLEYQQKQWTGKPAKGKIHTYITGGACCHYISILYNLKTWKYNSLVHFKWFQIHLKASQFQLSGHLLMPHKSWHFKHYFFIGNWTGRKSKKQIQ